MHTHPHLRDVAVFYKALGNERRLFILEILGRKNRTETELVSYLGIHPSAVSKHLSLLVRAGIVQGNRIGREVEFRLTPGMKTQDVIKIFHLLTKR